MATKSLQTFNPEKDTTQAENAAKQLVDIVKQKGWAIRVGNGEHLVYEAWQTLGKYYGFTVKTFDAVPVTLGSVQGFHAKSSVIDNKTGFEIGGAEAYCMRDEGNWRAKPLFQLASMAQTRAGAKALRQMLSFVVALAGYNATPAEEMEVEAIPENTKTKGFKATAKQIMYIRRELKRTGYSEVDLTKKYGDITTLTVNDASKIINNLSGLPEVIDVDEIPDFPEKE